jgi:hypothetical protein
LRPYLVLALADAARAKGDEADQLPLRERHERADAVQAVRCFAKELLFIDDGEERVVQRLCACAQEPQSTGGVTHSAISSLSVLHAPAGCPRR